MIVGFLLFSAKHYSRELYPEMAIWGYEDLAFAAFGPVGKVRELITQDSSLNQHNVMCYCSFLYTIPDYRLNNTDHFVVPVSDCLHDLYQRPGQ